jgi:hypothetical protein
MRIILITLLLFSTSLHAQQWTLKGLPIDGEAADDLSGTSVDMSANGDIVAIGAYFNQGNGYASGHCRIFEWDGMTWQQLGDDIDGEAQGDNSGISVALNEDGTVVAIGAYGNDAGGMDRGHARVFQWNGTSWQQMGADIDGEADSDWSGIAVDLSADGETVIVGAYKSNSTAFDSGRSRIFQWNGSGWVQKGSSIDGQNFGDQSGFSVSMSSDGNTIAISDFTNDDNGSDAGKIRMFQWSGSDWVQKGTDILGEAAADQFGFDVSLSADGNTVAAGAKRNDGSANDAGNARVFEWSGSAWIQKGQSLQGEAAMDNFGVSLALNAGGDTLIVGADRNDNGGIDRGHVRIFAWSGSAWTQIGTDLDGEGNSDWFGISTATSADGWTIAVGGYGNDNFANDAGHTRIYRYCPNNIDPSITINGTTLTAVASGYSYQWLDCDNGYTPIPGETAQSFTYSAYGNYAVEIDDGYCPTISNCVLIDGASLDTEEQLFKWYINDQESILYIHFLTEHSIEQLKMYNMNGQLVYTNSGPFSESIEVSLPRAHGLYLLQMIGSEGTVFTEKILR